MFSLPGENTYKFGNVRPSRRRTFRIGKAPREREKEGETRCILIYSREYGLVSIPGEMSLGK